MTTARSRCILPPCETATTTQIPGRRDHFAQRFDIDLDEALAAKMKLNAERYPIEKSRGKNLKYGDL